jgi:hypothetical protein
LRYIKFKSRAKSKHLQLQCVVEIGTPGSEGGDDISEDAIIVLFPKRPGHHCNNFYEKRLSKIFFAFSNMLKKSRSKFHWMLAYCQQSELKGHSNRR